jgi:hypothetical protein
MISDDAQAGVHIVPTPVSSAARSISGVNKSVSKPLTFPQHRRHTLQPHPRVDGRSAAVSFCTRLSYQRIDDGRTVELHEHEIQIST